MINRLEISGQIRLKALLSLAFAAIFMLFAWFAWNHLPESVSLSPKPVSTAVERVYLGPSNSLAVLSFNIESEGETPEYLGRGVARELAEMLAAVPSLQVTAPTSSLIPDASNWSLDVTAQRLRVAHLVTGTIALEDDRIRLAVGLWDARSEEWDWKTTLEQSLQDLDVLFKEVSGELLAHMPRKRSHPTPMYSRVQPESWLAYLQGRAQATAGSLEAAANHLQRSVEIDSRFPAAQLELARLALLATPPDRDAAMDGIGNILQQDPHFARALGLRSYIERNLDWNWAAAMDSALSAARLVPGEAAMLNLAGQAVFSMGRHREAAEFFAEAVVRDPLNLNLRLGLGLAQEYLGQFDEALKTYRILLGLRPDFPGVHAYRARIKLLQDNPDSAFRESEQETDPFWKSYSRTLALVGQGKTEEALVQWEELIADYGDSAAFQFAEIASYLGRTDDSFTWLETARIIRDAGVPELLGNRFLAGLHGDPRWPQILTELGLPLDAARLND